MKTLILGLITALGCNYASAVEETATGYGSTVAEALQNAKVLATEQAASTFVTGKKEVINGRYSETIGQYSGGLIKSYKIISSTTTSSGCEVTIVADVNIDKVNTIITTGNTAPSAVSSELEKAEYEHNKTIDAFNEISNISPMFGAKIDDVKYENRGSKVMVTYSAHLEWTPKWIDDMETLGKAINRPISVSTAASTSLNILGTLSALVTPGLYSTVYAAAKHTENKPTDSEAICFSTVRPSSAKLDSCYGVYKLPQHDAIPKLIIVRATFFYHDGHKISKCFPVGNSNDNNMYTFYAAGSTVMFDFDQRKFPTDTLVMYRNSVHRFTFISDTTVEQLKQVSEVIVDVVRSKDMCNS